jgi:SAM-dependent methyltransferase
VLANLRSLLGGLLPAAQRRDHVASVAPEHADHLERIRAWDPSITVLDQPKYETGGHPYSYKHFECEFAARHVPADGHILDVGSYRLFILGLLARGPVTTLDVRPRKASGSSETILTGDAREIPLDDRSVDCVVSLSSIEHFGLGRYGDPFDPDGDRKAMAEMVRVIRPGGILLFTTTLTRGQPCIAFPRHRIYTLEQIHALCDGLDPVAEEYFSRSLGEGADLERIVHETGQWDVYCGCWRKC